MPNITPNAPNRSDSLLRTKLALPGPSASAESEALDIGIHEGSMLVPVELVVDIPALTAAQLPDGKAIDGEIQHADHLDGEFEPVAFGAGMVAEGADGVGQAARRIRFHPASDIKRYVRLAIATGEGTAAAGVEIGVRFVY